MVRWLCLGILVLLPTPAWAWGEEGHSIVAEIAQRHLTDKTADEIDKLIGRGASLASISTWADDVRQDRPKSYNWHFVDIPLAVATYDETRDCEDTDRGDCAIKEIARNETVLRDTKASVTDRVEALKFLVHFVGDIHQPLHTVLEFRGGNDRHVVFFVDPIKEVRIPTNLHAVWDSGLIRAKYWSWGTYMDHLEAEWIPQQDVTALTKGTPVEWVEETHSAAVDLAGANVKENMGLHEDYLKKVEPVLDHQLGAAGLRLAAIFNDIFDPK